MSTPEPRKKRGEPAREADHTTPQVLSGDAARGAELERCDPKQRRREGARRSKLLRLAPGQVAWEPPSLRHGALAGLPPGGREECRLGQRPCPYVMCREHLWRVDSWDRQGHRHEGRPPTTVIRAHSEASCAVDHYGREHSFAQVGAKVGVGKRRAQQIAKGALEKLGVWVGDDGELRPLDGP